MNITINHRTVAGGALFLLMFAGVIAAAVHSDSDNQLVAYFAVLPIFAVQILGIVGVGLLAVFLSQWVRNREGFDGSGAAREMSVVRGRIGTPEERPGDNTAAAVQYAATTLLLAIVLLAFFLVHGR